MTVNRLNHERFGLIALTRSGYTGEDGYEILIGEDRALELAEALLAHSEVKPIGLGARDTLRLEAGLCLYGHELDENISPIEAGLSWTIQLRRRTARDFPGASRIASELSGGTKIRRVGIRPADRAPARDGTEIQIGGKKIGVVTSGGFSPTLNAPISMGYVETAFSEPGTKIDLIVRGKPRAGEIVALPFVRHNYFKG
jgi:aminomethyltransferase